MAKIEQPSKDPSAAASHRAARLLECYQRGVRLATCEKDYDYAHAMFAECVLHDPGNLKFAEAMVQNLRARTPKRKKSLLALGRGGSRSIKSAQQCNKWDEVLRKGIDLLKTNPWDVTTLQAMAEACAARHHNEVELVYLKQALDAEPKNVAVNAHCARSLGRMGQFDQAIACWHRVEKLKGKDAEATKMISMLAEEKLKYPGGRPPGTPAKPATADEPRPQETPCDVVLSPQQKLEQAIALDPQNASNYLELVDLLLNSNRFDAAETLLTRALSACGQEQSLLDQLHQVRYLRDEEVRKTAEQRKSDSKEKNAPLRLPWLELALAGALVALLVQLIPAVRTVVDATQWSRSGWLIFSVILLIGLITIRARPDFRELLQRRRIRRKISQGQAGNSVKT